MLARAMTISVVLALLGVPNAGSAQAIPGAFRESTTALSRGEWPAYAGTYGAAHYSPLAQIDRINAKNLHIAWRWKSPVPVVNPIGLTTEAESRNAPVP